MRTTVVRAAVVCGAFVACAAFLRTTVACPAAPAVAGAAVERSDTARGAELARFPCSRELSVAGADHVFDRSGRKLAAAIAAFLDEVLRDDCGR